jgi:hypothetical protein
LVPASRGAGFSGTGTYHGGTSGLPAAQSCIDFRGPQTKFTFKYTRFEPNLNAQSVKTQWSSGAVITKTLTFFR